MRELVLVFVTMTATSFCQSQHQTPHPKGDGGPATAAEINGPSAIAIDDNGNLYVYELVGGAIRKIDGSSQIITTLVEGCNPPWQKPIPTGCVGPIGQLTVISSVIRNSFRQRRGDIAPQGNGCGRLRSVAKIVHG
jgi:hypothetical protein